MYAKSIDGSLWFNWQATIAWLSYLRGNLPRSRSHSRRRAGKVGHHRRHNPGSTSAIVFAGYYSLRWDV